MVLTFLQIHNILAHWSIEYQSRFFSLVYNCVSVGYDNCCFMSDVLVAAIFMTVSYGSVHTAVFFNL